MCPYSPPPAVGWTPTFEHYVVRALAQNASYTPADAGLFCLGAEHDGPRLQLYGTDWQKADHTEDYGGMAIGDGTNFRVFNPGPSTYEIVLMRMR